MESRREVLARAVVSAWHQGEPYGLLLQELGRECGMSKSQANIWAQEFIERSGK